MPQNPEISQQSHEPKMMSVFDQAVKASEKAQFSQPTREPQTETRIEADWFNREFYTNR